ncbi:hypothetical protein DF186_24375, partial [Enterococcus hirae]
SWVVLLVDVVVMGLIIFYCDGVCVLLCWVELVYFSYVDVVLGWILILMLVGVVVIGMWVGNVILWLDCDGYLCDIMVD